MKLETTQTLIDEDRDIEFNPEYFPPHRSVGSIKFDLHNAISEHKALQLKLELAEAELHHFCMTAFQNPISGCYIEQFSRPKRLMEQARITALRALRTYEIENEIKP